jgi:outer membrane protein assembly factor BamB
VTVLCTVNAIACAPVIRHGPESQPVTWPVYLGSPAHDIDATEHLDATPQPAWRANPGREIRGAAAAGKGVLAVGTTDRVVALLGTDSGQVLWDHRLAGTIRGGPLLTDNRVYVATEETPSGRVYALEMRTGKTVWDEKTGGIAAALTLTKDGLFAGSETGVLMALNPDTGGIRWRRRLSGSIQVAPVSTAAGLVVATTADSLYLVDPVTGTIVRRTQTPGAVLGTPATDGAHVYFATVTGTVASVEAATLDTVWTREVGSGVYGAPAIARDTLFVLTRAGRLVRVPLGSPVSAQSVELNLVSVAGPTPLANGVLVADVGGVVRCVDPATGAERWRVTVPGPLEQPPLVWGGRLILVAGRGEVVSYQ